MKYIYLLIIFSILFSSCKKSTETPVSKLDFEYTEVMPNILIGYDSLQTIAVYKVDLNKDSVNDFQIGALKNVILVNGHYVYGQTFSITSIDSNEVLGSINYLEYPQDKLLNSNYILNYPSTNWTKEFNFFLNVAGTGVTCQSDSSKYLGLMVKKMNQKYFGWIKLDWDLSNKVLRVRSFAITKKSDITIYTGQLN